jgi:hypothetical protein
MSDMTAITLTVAIGFVFAVASASACAQPTPYSPAAPPQPERVNVITNGPQASPSDFGDWSARRDVMRSAEYDRLLETNLAFRRRRERSECGPVGYPLLHRQCIASFARYEPVNTASLRARWRDVADQRSSPDRQMPASRD